MNTRLSPANRVLVRGLGVVALITGATVAMLLLAGCSPKVEASPSMEPVKATPAPVVERPDNIVDFGETYTWIDEVAISVSTPVEFVPSEYAFGLEEGDTAVAFTIVITNLSDEVVDPMSFTDVTSGGFPSAVIMDADSPVGDMLLRPSASLLPGKSVQWIEAFSVKDPADLTLEVTPGMRGYDNAIFTNVD